MVTAHQKHRNGTRRQLGSTSLGGLTLCLSCRTGTAPVRAGVAPTVAVIATLDEVVEVGGLALFIHCEGVGTPLVVLESGLGLGASHWQRVGCRPQGRCLARSS